jgi:hypothetical protein
VHRLVGAVEPVPRNILGEEQPAAVGVCSVLSRASTAAAASNSGRALSPSTMMWRGRWTARR